MPLGTCLIGDDRRYGDSPRAHAKGSGVGHGWRCGEDELIAETLMFLRIINSDKRYYPLFMPTNEIDTLIRAASIR